MRILILASLFMLLAVIGSSAQQTAVELPDYTNWMQTADHSESFVYKGAQIALRDQHYIVEREKVDYVLVYFTPEDNNKMWFAIHMVFDRDTSELHGFLFERKNESWLFIQNLSNIDLNDMAPIFESRYDLIQK